MNELNADVFKIPKKVTLSDNVTEFVAKAICIGILKPNERLTEQGISERVGVSRAPIREAMKIMCAQGLLVKEPITGYRVASFDKKAEKIVLLARQSIEAILLQNAVEEWRTTDPKLTVLAEAISMMKIAANKNDHWGSLNADLAFHKSIATAGKNDVAATLWDTISRHVLIFLSLNKYRSHDLNVVVDRHEKFRNLIFTKLNSGFTIDEAYSAFEDHFSPAWAVERDTNIAMVDTKVVGVMTESGVWAV